MAVRQATPTDGWSGAERLPRQSFEPAPDRGMVAGVVLADRYELRSELGRGGMGRVYQAQDRLLGRDVALKVLTTADDGEPARQACLREARVAARVAHPNVATILDVGADHDFDVTFLVMELVPGRTLRDVRRAAGTLAPAEAVELVAQVASALEATHARGVVHGDVTPRNVLVRSDGMVKLVDFGIARVMDGRRPIETHSRYGSVPYLAPEQVNGAPPDARSDVYALGAVLYELLVGEPPYTGRDTATVMAARLVADPPPPSGRNPAISPALERVVLTALARDPERRFSSAGALRDALCRVANAAASETRVLSMPSAPAAALARPGTHEATLAPSTPGTRSDRAQTRLARRLTLGSGALGLAGLAILLGLALLAFAFWRGVGTTDSRSDGLPGTGWASLTRQTCEWSNMTTPPGLCFGERPAAFRVRVVERGGPRWMVWDPTTRGVAYVDAEALTAD